jgi:hypothetical protein
VLSPEFCGKFTFRVSLKQVKKKNSHIVFYWKIPTTQWYQAMSSGYLSLCLIHDIFCCCDSLVLEKEWCNVL